MSKIFLYGFSILVLFSSVYAGPVTTENGEKMYTNDAGQNNNQVSKKHITNPFVTKNDNPYLTNAGETDNGVEAAPLINGKTPLPQEQLENTSSTITTENKNAEIPLSSSSIQKTQDNPYANNDNDADKNPYVEELYNSSANKNDMSSSNNQNDEDLDAMLASLNDKEPVSNNTFSNSNSANIKLNDPTLNNKSNNLVLSKNDSFAIPNNDNQNLDNKKQKLMPNGNNNFAIISNNIGKSTVSSDKLLAVVRKDIQDLKSIFNQQAKIIQEQAQRDSEKINETYNDLKKLGILAITNSNGEVLKVTSKKQLYNIIHSKPQQIKHLPTMLLTNIKFPSQTANFIMQSKIMMQQRYNNMYNNASYNMHGYNQNIQQMQGMQYQPRNY